MKNNFIRGAGRMSHPGTFELGSVLVSAIFSRRDYLLLLETELKRKWGRVILVSRDFNFNVDYYEKEMGKPLFRRFYLLEGLFPPDVLVPLKLWAYSFEVYSAKNGKRGIDLDPGLVFTPSLIIATFKPYSHRIPLKKGVYAHLELLFSRGKPSPLPWTYPDFASGLYFAFLEEAWKIHRSRV